jgi:uncharacterized membrane protein
MQKWQMNRKGWQLLCITLLILGIFFRFTNLGKKVYWHDEVLTSLRVSGYSRSELVNELFVGREVGVAELQAFQHLNPKRTLGDIIHRSAKENPQHPPLYLVLLRVWLQGVGDSVTTTRALSAGISLLTFPCLYWLCMELFESPLMAWAAIALLSISPFQVLYAQEAREYTLWTVTTLLCSAALLRAMRLQTRRGWLLYTLTLTLSLYTFLFSGLVAVGHGVYVLANGGIQKAKGRFRVTETAIAYFTSSFYALLAFTPWVFIFLKDFHSASSGTTWTQVPLPTSVLTELWMFNLSRLFVDFNPYIDDLAAYLLIIPILILEIIAAYFLLRHTSKQVWLFILTLMASVALPIALADLLLGGQRSTATRYLVPLQIGLLLLVTYFLFSQINPAKPRLRLMCRSFLVALVVTGILSCGASSQASVWWNKGISHLNPQIAAVINSTEHPILVSDAFDVNPGNVISLSYLLDDKTRFILLPEIKDSTAVVFPATSEQFTNWFFLGLPEAFLQDFSKKYDVNIMPVVSNLWQVQH